MNCGICSSLILPDEKIGRCQLCGGFFCEIHTASDICAACVHSLDKTFAERLANTREGDPHPVISFTITPLEIMERESDMERARR